MKYLLPILVCAILTPAFQVLAAEPLTSVADETTFLAGKIRLRDIPIEKVTAKLGEFELASPETLFVAQTVYTVRGMLLSTGVEDVYFAASVEDILLDSPAFLAVVIPVANREQRQAVAHLLRLASGILPEHIDSDGAVIAGPSHVISRLNSRPRQERQDLAKALASVENSAIQFAVVPPEGYAKIIREVLAEPIDRLPVAPGPVLAEGRWLALGVDLLDEPSLQIVGELSSEPAAHDMQGLLENSIELIGTASVLADTGMDIVALKKQVLPDVQENQLAVRFGPEGRPTDQLEKAIATMLRYGRLTNHRSHSINNLREISIAMHNYHDANKSFPASASFDDDGNALLSWRVLVLPYLGHSDLYQQFRLDEPWSSEHNSALVTRMPTIYETPTIEELPEGHTCYLVPTGEGTLFDGQQGKAIRDITDGSSNTIMIVEAASELATPWTKPSDFDVQQGDLSNKLVGLRDGGFLTARADASVQFNPIDIPTEVLLLQLLIADGKVIPREW